MFRPLTIVGVPLSKRRPASKPSELERGRALIQLVDCEMEFVHLDAELGAAHVIVLLTDHWEFQ